MAAAARAGLLAVLCLACALTGSFATRMPDDQAFVSITLQQGARRYILEGSPAHTAEMHAHAPAPAPALASSSNLTQASMPAKASDKAGMGTQGVTKFASSYDNNEISEDKVLAKGSSCNIYSTSTLLQCTSKAPLPACCTSASNSATCYTFDSGKSLDCVTSVPYPACCTARDQPASVCRSPDRQGVCDVSTPIPACCTSKGVCSVWSNASDVKCSKENRPGCCPA